MPFDTQTAREAQAESAEVRRNSPVKTLNKMQERLAEAVLDKETEPREAAQCACAWDKLEARKAVLQGKPANTSQSIKQESPKSSKSSSSGPLEPIPEEKPEV